MRVPDAGAGAVALGVGVPHVGVTHRPLLFRALPFGHTAARELPCELRGAAAARGDDETIYSVGITRRRGTLARRSGCSKLGWA